MRFFQEFTTQCRKCLSMIAAHVEALAAVCDSTDQHRLMRTKVVARIGFRQFAVYIAVQSEPCRRLQL